MIEKQNCSFGTPLTTTSEKTSNYMPLRVDPTRTSQIFLLLIFSSNNVIKS